MDAEEKNDAFYTLIEFGTAGMRGLLGPGTNRINLHTIRKATQGFANYIKAHGEAACEAGIAIGYDNRHMSREFAFDSAKLLAKNGIKSYVFESLRPTPDAKLRGSGAGLLWRHYDYGQPQSERI